MVYVRSHKRDRGRVLVRAHTRSPPLKIRVYGEHKGKLLPLPLLPKSKQAKIKKTLNEFYRLVGKEKVRKWHELGRARGIPLKINFLEMGYFVLGGYVGGDYIQGTGNIMVYNYTHPDYTPHELALTLAHEFAHYVQDVRNQLYRPEPVVESEAERFVERLLESKRQ